MEEYLTRLLYDILGAAMEVYNTLGPGLLESVYEKALLRELEIRGIYATSQVPVEIVYKGKVVGNDLRIDLLVENEIVVELKSVEELQRVHYKQLRTYMQLLNLPVGLLVNFGEGDFMKGMITLENKQYIHHED